MAHGSRKHRRVFCHAEEMRKILEIKRDQWICAVSSNHFRSNTGYGVGTNRPGRGSCAQREWRANVVTELDVIQSLSNRNSSRASNAWPGIPILQSDHVFMWNEIEALNN